MQSNLKESEALLAASDSSQLCSPIDSEWLKAQILEAKASFASLVESGNKEEIKKAHITAKKLSDTNRFKNTKFLTKKYSKFLIDGTQIQPAQISPILVEVTSDSEAELFRLARSSWSMPYSKGYGRRLRFIIIDEAHGALMGAVGLQSPPADLKCRDKLFENSGNKLHWVNSTMDAYTVGAVGPYRQLLGGKLAAGVLASKEVQQAYWRKYGAATTVINGSKLSQPLTAVTTASAFGRSSIYNRLKYNDHLIAERLGYTQGYGSIHLEHLYPVICQFLRERNKLRKGGFGKGPKIRWQNIHTAALELNLPSKILLHGLQREVFLFRHAINFEKAALGLEKPIPGTLSFSDWRDFWKERYCVPRSLRTSAYLQVSTVNDILTAILT